MTIHDKITSHYSKYIHTVHTYIIALGGECPTKNSAKYGGRMVHPGPASHLGNTLRCTAARDNSEVMTEKSLFSWPRNKLMQGAWAQLDPVSLLRRRRRRGHYLVMLFEEPTFVACCFCSCVVGCNQPGCMCRNACMVSNGCIDSYRFMYLCLFVGLLVCCLFANR